MKRVIKEANEAGGDYDKYCFNANKLDVYMKKDHLMIKGGYYIKFSASDGKNLVCRFIGDHVFNGTKNNGEIGLQGFCFYLFVDMVVERDNDSINFLFC